MGNANCGEGFACDLHALTAAERLRHRELLQRLRPSARHISELANGYQFHLNSGDISFREAAEWVDLERRCCPFLAFQLQIAGGQSGIVLEVTGPEGVKLFIDAELR